MERKQSASKVSRAASVLKAEICQKSGKALAFAHSIPQV